MKVKPFYQYTNLINQEDLYGFHFLKQDETFYDDFYDESIDDESRVPIIKFTEKIPLVLYELLTDSEKARYHEFLIDSANDED